MTDRSVTHATFDLERRYPVPVERVFAAWADPAAKARWFAAPGGGHELDFRVGGREVNRGRHGDGPPLTFEARYHEILPGERIVYSSTLHARDTLTTASLTTVTFAPDGEGAILVLTEQGTYLDGHEDPAWREQGTAGWLDALGTHLREGPS
ncbi:SRPBCC family protein [Actinomadura sp. DC4]|uniref:SRPBCC family protein n=1 Tax=Actinomadura sp. DC4 TaxID=3055069 RepID=UPI0025B23365|nr:SRPBCC family protein [Actinomadura sp. DC4]MDN3357671.1 SRPBCC family protein [Actinomadura sp. DC4]